MNNRYQRFIDKRKQEGKKRRSLWCTDQEWALLNYFTKELKTDVVDYCLDIREYDLCMIVDSEFEEIPLYTIVRIGGICFNDGKKYVIFNYKGKSYIHSLYKLRKIILKGI